MAVMQAGRLLLMLAVAGVARAEARAVGEPLPPLPAAAKLVLSEDWSSGRVEPSRWYSPRKRWGQGNNGVTPDNVRVVRSTELGPRHYLVCQANGDLYDGPVKGAGGKVTRVGGMVVSRTFLASGRYEVAIRIGGSVRVPGGPEDPLRPRGAVPAIWTYGYRLLKAPGDPDAFHPTVPAYNPHFKVWGDSNELWSEIDFPEFGARGDFDKGLYNVFLQRKHQPRTGDVASVIDGRWHTLVTEWRTGLVPLPGVTDAQVTSHGGFHWVQDRSVDINRYLGNPLRRLGPDRYAVCAGLRATHYIDGRKVAENPTFVPSMAAQLTLGVWLPEWGGPAPWKVAEVAFGPVRVWQYNDPGDVRGVIVSDVADNF